MELYIMRMKLWLNVFFIAYPIFERLKNRVRIAIKPGENTMFNFTCNILMESVLSNPAPLLSPSDKMIATTPITKFYSGKSVFITGGSGFLGTILLGRLLATCSLKQVFLLMKPKEGKSIQERITELLKSPVFDEVRKSNPSALNHIIPIYGNLGDTKLGISEKDIAILNQEVQVVFHSAATIDMDTTLTDAIELNTKGTAELYQLCKGMQQLRVFVYVSTAYSNCNRDLIDERVYMPAASLEAIIDIYKELDKPTNQNSTQQIIEGRPNKYTYSKSLAENIVSNGLIGIPAVIVRPSIITSPIKHPMPGWTVSLNSMNHLAIAISEGALRCIHGSSTLAIDMVPVDHVANLLIASAWDADKQNLKQVKVFNCCSGLQNPITLKEVLCSFAYIYRKHCDKMFSTSMLIYTENIVLHDILWFFLQVVPAYFLDTLAWLLGRETSALRIHKKVLRTKSAVAYFGLHENTFITYNMRRLFRDMDESDRAMFDFDISSVDWPSYLEVYLLGLRKYILHK